MPSINSKEPSTLHFFVFESAFENRPNLKIFWGSKEKETFILFETVFVCLFFADRGPRGMGRTGLTSSFYNIEKVRRCLHDAHILFHSR